jgi:hypothetical protein
MEARIVFQRALAMASKFRYGLDEVLFQRIERLDVDDAVSEANRWLAERVGDGDVLLAFAEREVFRVPASLFLGQWFDMFGPSRDDVVILPISGGWVLFYSHEDEFEIARGGAADMSVLPTP